MKKIRRNRISSSLRFEIARILHHELKDPRIGFTSVIAVEPTVDLKEAVVRVSLMGTEPQQRTTMRGLEAARGYIQGLLAERIRLRNTPQLRFVQDETIKKAMDLESLIQRARAEDQAAAESRARLPQPLEDESQP